MCVHLCARGACTGRGRGEGAAEADAQAAVGEPAAAGPDRQQVRGVPLLRGADQGRRAVVLHVCGHAGQQPPGGFGRRRPRHAAQVDAGTSCRLAALSSLTAAPRRP
jgi:hypothetical protein